VTAGVQPGAAPAAAPLTAAEQLTAANDILNRGAKLSQRVGQLLDEARREADMIRVT
jgi:ribosomal protein S16